jgi:DivIVA domain-containing protein
MDMPASLVVGSPAAWLAPRLLSLYFRRSRRPGRRYGRAVVRRGQPGRGLYRLGVYIGALGALKALDALQARIRFSRLLRRPSDPRTATVTASRRGGRTVILDIVPRDGTRRAYRPLSVPGESVKIYAEHRPAHMGAGGSGKSPLLASSPQRGRAFLGTMQSRSPVQPGPLTPLDENVSGATVVDWAEWADSTTFSKHNWRRRGYEPIEVDAFLDAIRDTFLGVSQPPVRSGNVRGKQFSTHRPGYDKKQVDAFLEAAGIRLAAMESTDKPQGPLASGAILADWAEWADSTRFSTAAVLQGYARAEVDGFREVLRDTFLGVRQPPLTSHAVHGKQFTPTRVRGYDVQQVDAFLDQGELRPAAMLP